MSKPQSYENHTRWFPLQHFVIAPLLLILLFYRIVRFYHNPDSDNGVWIGVVILLALISISARLQALRVQDRLIRLEERLRYKEMLNPELLKRAENLTLDQVIALRFTSDEELPVLLERVLNGEFSNSKEIKKSVRNWRADDLRA